MRDGIRRWGWVLGLGSLAPGCSLENPNFSPSSGSVTETSDNPSEATTAPDTTTGDPGTTSTMGSGDPSTTEPSTTDPSTTDPSTADPSTTDPSTTDPSTTDPDTETGSTTDGTEHLGSGTHTLPATIATCILRADEEEGAPHGPPTECRDNSRQQNLACMGDELETLMQIDTEVNNFGGLKRRSETFLRFEIPPIAGGLEVVGASLHVRHAIHKACYRPQTGEVWRSSPFDARSLDADAPVLEDLLAADLLDMGEDLFDRFPDLWVVWELPLDPNVLAPGQPLYLSLQPTHTLGAYYHGLGDDLGDAPPELHLTIE